MQEHWHDPFPNFYPLIPPPPVSSGDVFQLIAHHSQIFSLRWTLSGSDTSHTSLMNSRHSLDKLAWGSRLLAPHTKVPRDLCFDLSRLIAESIKMFFIEIMWAGKGPRGSVLFTAVDCLQCCSRESERVRDSEVGLPEWAANTSDRFPVQIRWIYSEIRVTERNLYQD